MWSQTLVIHEWCIGWQQRSKSVALRVLYVWHVLTRNTWVARCWNRRAPELCITKISNLANSLTNYIAGKVDITRSCVNSSRLTHSLDELQWNSSGVMLYLSEPSRTLFTAVLFSFWGGMLANAPREFEDDGVMHLPYKRRHSKKRYDSLIEMTDANIFKKFC